MQKVLYAREYGIIMPERPLRDTGIEIVSFHRPKEAIREITRNKGSYAAYTLGMMMVRDDTEVSDVDQVDQELTDTVLQLDDMDEDPLSSRTERNAFHEARFRMRVLSKEKYGLLHDSGGLAVYEHLRAEGELGKKPIVWFTTQYKVHRAIKKIPEQRVDVLDLPLDTETILDWFTANVRNS